MTTQEQAKDVVSQVLADKADKGGIKRVVWIGAGGSNGGNYPAQYFMEHEATQVVSSSYTSNEFVHATPAYVNENTLAVVVSMRRHQGDHRRRPGRQGPRRQHHRHLC